MCLPRFFFFLSGDHRSQRWYIDMYSVIIISPSPHLDRMHRQSPPPPTWGKPNRVVWMKTPDRVVSLRGVKSVRERDKRSVAMVNNTAPRRHPALSVSRLYVSLQRK